MHNPLSHTHAHTHMHVYTLTHKHLHTETGPLHLKNQFIVRHVMLGGWKEQTINYETFHSVCHYNWLTH